jgi:hypothetical protein
MSDYEACREFFMQLSILNCPRKHWSASLGWDMADSMSKVLSIHTKKILAKARFYAISADEVTTVDHESWLTVHIYISVGFSRIPILLSLSRLTEGNGASSVKESIITSLEELWTMFLPQGLCASGQMGCLCSKAVACRSGVT